MQNLVLELLIDDVFDGFAGLDSIELADLLTVKLGLHGVHKGETLSLDGLVEVAVLGDERSYPSLLDIEGRRLHGLGPIVNVEVLLRQSKHENGVPAGPRLPQVKAKL